MKNNLLYFPTIDIPNNNWTIKSILYWDEVGIIVPRAFIEEPKQYKHSTRELLKSDLIKQIIPSEYISGSKSFNEGFISLLSNPNFGLEEKQSNFKNEKYSKIHFEKFGYELMNVLIEFKIAQRGDSGWYFVEGKTANLLMTYLAFYIGEKDNYLPSTDNVENVDISLNQDGKALKNNEIRKKLLEDLMPYPINPDLNKLRKFKDKHNKELKIFRILLEKTVFEISKNDNLSDEKHYYDLVLAEIIDKKDKILSDLNQSKIGQVDVGTLFSIASSLSLCTQDSDLYKVIGILGAAYYAVKVFDKTPAIDKDFSYLALVDKNFK